MSPSADPPAAPPPHIRTGHILALRLFDAADHIDLEHAERLWRAAHPSPTRRPRLATAPATAMTFGVAPLAIDLPPAELTLPTGPITAAITARLYDFGAISLTARLPADKLPWPDYADRLNAAHAALGPDGTAQPWPALLAALLATIGPALRTPSAERIEEDYLVAVVTALDTPFTSEDLERQVDLAALLSGETRPLSPAARADLLRHRFSWYADDLVALTWDRAFVYEPRGETDVTDILEVANAQLLEMRYYDELLDAELPRMYGHVATIRRGLNLFAARRYSGLARQLHMLVVEVTELTERVDNALQVTEDIYLARVYAAALDQFRVAAVTQAVNRKLALIRDTYTALYDEAAGARTEVMEIAIIALITIEVVMALWRH